MIRIDAWVAAITLVAGSSWGGNLLAAGRDSSPKAKPVSALGIKFYSSVEGAAEKARSLAKKQNPMPVVWLRMLGDLEGKT